MQNQENKMVNKMVIVCDNCKNEFEFHDKLLKREFVDVGDKFIKLTYFICDKCKTVYNVIIVDSMYTGLFIAQEKAKVKLQKVAKKKKFHAIKNKQAIYDKAKQALIEYEKELKTKYERCFYIDENNNIKYRRKENENG